MEASSTTLNIASPAAEPEAPKVATAGQGAVMHNHGANFGRYVPDCPACIKRHPDGPPVRGAVKRAKVLMKLEAERIVQKAVKDAVSGPVQVDTLLSEIDNLKRQLAQAKKNPFTIPDDVRLPERRVEENDMSALVGIMLRKEAAIAKKEQAQELRAEDSRASMLMMVRQKESDDEARIANCASTGHRKDNGRTAINGQIHNDGLYHPICFHCFKEFPPVRPRGEFINNGVQDGVVL